MDNIIFSGDSFIWGEGLELYIDTPYWISQREIYNEWIGIDGGLGLIDKQTPETNKFREDNRFATLVGNKFGLQPIVREDNGGDWHSSRLIVEENLSLKTKYIIHMFTSIDRNFLHSEITCNCHFCSIDKPKPFNLYIDYVSKILNNEPIDTLMQSKIDYLETHEGIPKFTFERLTEWENNYRGDLVSYVDFIFDKHRLKNMEDHLEKFKLYQKTAKVYFIDSWCTHTSFQYVRNHPFIESLLIPLKGYDGNYYKYYSDWESTFEHKRIDVEFPKTKNIHPTLLQQKYLAESIIEHIENDTTEINPIQFHRKIF